jgi:hypothetical protein
MMKCTRAQQVRAFFGIGLVMLSLQAFAVAPLCGGVFNSQAVLSQKEIDDKISEIAKLKLEIDTSLSSGGEKKLGEQLVRNNFNKVLESVVHDLRNHKSENEIRALISAKIAELQGRKAEEKKIENEVREASKIEFPKFNRPYKIRTSWKLDVEPAGQNRLFEVIASVAVFESVGKDVFDISIVDLQTKERVTPVEGVVASAVQRNRNNIYYLKPSGELSVYNLTQKTSKVVLQTNLLGPEKFENGVTQPKMDIDSTGRYIVIKMSRGVHFVDLVEGSIKQFTKDVNFAKFVNDSIVTASSAGGDIVRYWIRNGKLGQPQYFDEFVDGIYDVFPTADQNHTVLWGNKTVHASPETSYGDLFKHSFRFDDLDPSAGIHKVKGVASGGAFYVKHTDDMTSFFDLYIYDPQVGFTHAASLPTIRDSSGIESIAITDSGDRIITTHQVHSDVFIDVWSE